MVRVFEASLAHLKEMTQFVKNEAQNIGFSGSVLNQIEVAIEEVVVNVIHYGYGGREALDSPFWGKIKIEVKREEKPAALLVVITDWASAFDPLKACPSPNDTKGEISVEKMKMGGLGIPLIKGIMDVVDYQRVDNMNILTLRKLKNS